MPDEHDTFTDPIDHAGPVRQRVARTLLPWLLVAALTACADLTPAPLANAAPATLTLSDDAVRTLQRGGRVVLRKAGGGAVEGQGMIGCVEKCVTFTVKNADGSTETFEYCYVPSNCG